MCKSFRYSSNDQGLANMAISMAHNVAADNQHTRNLLNLGDRVIAYSSRAKYGTYVLAGIAMGKSSSLQPWQDDYQLVHTITWATSIVFVPHTDVPVPSTTSAGADHADRLFAYAAAQSGIFI